MTKRSLVGTAFAMTMFSAASAVAVQSKCLAGKYACVAKKANSLLVCHQRAETPRKPADPNFNGCIDKAKAAFDGGAKPEKGCFEKLENKNGNDCVTFDDTAHVEALVDACVAEMVAAVDPGEIDQTRCGVAKKKCVAKKFGALLKCHKLAATPNKPMDPNFDGCLDEAKARFDGGADPTKGCFAKEEAKASNDCRPPLGNQAALETIVDDCVAEVVAAAETPPPTTTSTTTTSTTTSSTTTTTIPGSVACGANGLNVTYAIQYPEAQLGGISAILMRKHYADPPLSIPGSGNVLSVRQRVASLLTPAAAYSVQVTTLGDHDGDDPGTVEDTLEVRATSTTSSIRPGSVFRTRFDCLGGAGTMVPQTALGCSFLQVGGLDGNPMPPELVALITCGVSLATAP
jgi:hypothetical protein